MPKIAVDEDGYLRGSEYEIWSPGQIGCMGTITLSDFTEDGFHLLFQARVLALDPRHHGASLRGTHDIAVMKTSVLATRRIYR